MGFQTVWPCVPAFLGKSTRSDGQEHDLDRLAQRDGPHSVEPLNRFGRVIRRRRILSGMTVPYRNWLGHLGQISSGVLNNRFQLPLDVRVSLDWFYIIRAVQVADMRCSESATSCILDDAAVKLRDQ